MPSSKATTQPVSTWILPPYLDGFRSMKLPAPATNSVPEPVNRSRMNPSPPLRPAENPAHLMSNFTEVSAATNASFSAVQPLEPSSSIARTSPGSVPANATSPEPPAGVKYWMASDSPARARLPTCTAAPMALPSNPLSLVASSCSCVVNRVSTPMFTVFHRNFPASQYTVWPWSSWHTIIWLALPLIWCLITASPRSESDEDSEALH